MSRGARAYVVGGRGGGGGHEKENEEEAVVCVISDANENGVLVLFFEGEMGREIHFCLIFLLRTSMLFCFSEGRERVSFLFSPFFVVTGNVFFTTRMSFSVVVRTGSRSEYDTSSLGSV